MTQTVTLEYIKFKEEVLKIVVTYFHTAMISICITTALSNRFPLKATLQMGGKADILQIWGIKAEKEGLAQSHMVYKVQIQTGSLTFSTASDTSLRKTEELVFQVLGGAGQ